MKSRFIVIYILLIATALLFTSLSTAVAPTMQPLGQFPQAFGEWRMIHEATFAGDVIAVLRPTDYLSREYADGKGNVVRLYIGFHDGSDRSGPIHSPKNCLPGSGWNSIAEKELQLTINKATLHLMQALYQKGVDQELFFYWFQMRGKSVTSEYNLKLTQLYNSVFNKRRDATFVRISMPVAVNNDISHAVGLKFINDFYPVFSTIIPL